MCTGNVSIFDHAVKPVGIETVEFASRDDYTDYVLLTAGFPASPRKVIIKPKQYELSEKYLFKSEKKQGQPDRFDRAGFTAYDFRDRAVPESAG